MVHAPVTGAGAGCGATEQATLHVNTTANRALSIKAHLSDHPIGCGMRIPHVGAGHLLAISKLRPRTL